MTTTATERLRAALARPVDAASLVAFRVLFGGLMLVAVGRFFWHGWIDEYFHQPSHFFHYWGLGWVTPLPRPLMHVLFAGLGGCALLIVIGRWHRVACVLFAVGFAYAHACDKTNYLNHYYLLVQVAVLLAILPVGRGVSTVPAWALYAVRAQVGLVYFFGGVAKLGPDWLLHGQPLATWLSANADFPIFGRYFAYPEVALTASWAAAFFDLTIVGWLLWSRTRPVAYLVVVAFHLATAKLFHLGLFPWAMTAFATIFFAPDWPRRWLPKATASSPARPLPRWLPLVAVHLVVQLLLPFRSALYGGNPLWHEQGFRFAWNVMLMEKSGVVEFRVTDPSTGQEWRVPASAYWTRYQAAMMASQPDMVLEAAHVVADDFRRRGVRAPEVRVDAFASLNGRPRARLIDPTVDLATQEDGLAAKPWILPAPR